MQREIKLSTLFLKMQGLENGKIIVILLLT
jgi:hypothetical protein